MNILNQTLTAIKPVNHQLPDEAAARIHSVMEGDDTALGELRSLLLKYLAITEERHPQPPEKCTVICCAERHLTTTPAPSVRLAPAPTSIGQSTTIAPLMCAAVVSDRLPVRLAVVTRAWLALPVAAVR